MGKDQHLALSSGMGLAGHAINIFWEYGISYSGVSIDDIAESVIKPNKKTAVHFFLSQLQDVAEEVDMLIKNLDSMEEVFDFIQRTLDEVNLIAELQKPNFEECNDNHGHFECDCSRLIKVWIEFVEENQDEINDLIVHSAFQFVFQDRKFLHDFHLELVHVIVDGMEYLRENYPNYVTVNGRIKRQPFPMWLKKAVNFREKGTCVICRSDLTGLVRTQNQPHIDHIVPLELFGTNDASNMQQLCSKCNTSKSARSTATGTVNVPYWNLDN